MHSHKDEDFPSSEYEEADRNTEKERERPELEPLLQGYSLIRSTERQCVMGYYRRLIAATTATVIERK